MHALETIKKMNNPNVDTLFEQHKHYADRIQFGLTLLKDTGLRLELAESFRDIVRTGQWHKLLFLNNTLSKALDSQNEGIE